MRLTTEMIKFIKENSGMTVSEYSKLYNKNKKDKQND